MFAIYILRDLPQIHVKYQGVKIHTNMNITVFINLWIIIAAVMGQSIVKAPPDTTMTIGGTAKLLCEVDYGEHVPTMTWKFNNTIIYFYINGEVEYPLGTNKYVVSNYHSLFSLEVRNLSYNDGGNYICEVIGQKKSAALIVLGSPVITQVTANLMAEKTAIFECEARFGGPNANKISLHHFVQLQLVLDDIIYQAKSHSQNDFLFRKVYEILVDDSMDTKDLKCEIGTTKTKHLMSSTKLNVQYSVRNVTYSPIYGNYLNGSNITCSARGNPIPLFEWRNRANPEIVIKGQLLNIANAMIGDNSWTCTARNSVDGRMYEDDITAKFEAASNLDGNLEQEEVSSSSIDGFNQRGKIPFLVVISIFGGCIAGFIGTTAYQRIRYGTGRSQNDEKNDKRKHLKWSGFPGSQRKKQPRHAEEGSARTSTSETRPMAGDLDS